MGWENKSALELAIKLDMNRLGRLGGKLLPGEDLWLVGGGFELAVLG